MRASWIIMPLVFVALSIPQVGAVSVTPEELSEASHWVAAKLEGKAETRPAEGYLMVYAKSGQVQKNEMGGHSLRIVNREYQRGLYCPSEGKIVVHLPASARSFEAIVGVDSNRVTSFYSNAGRGSVVATVDVSGKEAFKSPVLREGMPGMPVNVDLGGAKEVTLGVSDGGGGTLFGNDFNQADWAEARVTLADGKTVWLGELPVGPLRSAYTTDPPFSFRYGDRPSSVLLKTWEMAHSERKLDENRTELTLTYTDPLTGLQVRCAAVEYRDFPTVEWTLYFKNTSDQPTPILENIRALDTRLERNGDGEFVLHHSKGGPASATDFQPLETRLDQGADDQIAAGSGRTTSKQFPYFNVEWPGQGVIIVVGWPGDWAAQFTRDDGNGLRIQAGQELTHFRLLPGEEVRTPLMVLQFWKGEWIRSQNIWRKWMLAHNLPRPGEKLPPAQFAGTSGGQYIEMQQATEENQNMFIDRYLEEGLKADYWWMDAGWYPFKEGWWNTGTWEPDPKRFPHGLRAVADHAHAKGVKIIVWFEPERVTPGTWLWENHPEWLLGKDGQNKLFNYGNPDAWKWMTDHVDKLITDQGIDVYRQDFNFDPLSILRANDSEDRQGITEIRHVTGYLAYWDALRRGHPNMLTDTCSGGGGRDDLETLRRAVPLWRSDYAFETTGMQNLTYGLALWIPYFGTGVTALDAYAFRSQMTPALNVMWDLRRKDLDYDSLRHLAGQWRQVADNYYGDFYPLTPYATENDGWAAWQLDRPEVGEGMVQVFRRPQSPFESARLKLEGLDPVGRYTVRNLDVSGQTEMTGRELMEGGLPVLLKQEPEAAIIVYKRDESPRQR